MIQDEEPTVSLQLGDDQCVRAKNQVTDYECRGSELDDMSVLHFFKESYEEQIRHLSNEDTNIHAGRQRHTRVPYSSGHPLRASRQRVLRPDNHSNLLNFIGPWFPRRDNADKKDLYWSSMLMLFRPWRNIRRDLKRDDETWEEAFVAMETAMTAGDRRMLDNIQYHYHCKQAADVHSHDELEDPEIPLNEDANLVDEDYMEEHEEETREK